MEEFRTVCSNPWCKATFIFTENDVKDGVQPTKCDKCNSFNNELSAGVTWSDKKYEGDRFDGMPHQMTYKVRNFIK